MSADMTGRVVAAEFIREGDSIKCSTCSTAYCDPFGDYCCECCAERDKEPGSYLTIRLDGAPSLHGGRVVVTYVEGEVG